MAWPCPGLAPSKGVNFLCFKERFVPKNSAHFPWFLFLNLVRHLTVGGAMSGWISWRNRFRTLTKSNKLRNLHSRYPKANKGYSIEHEFSDGQPLDIDIVSDSIMETTTDMNGKTSKDNLLVVNSPGGTSWQDSNPQFLQLYSPKIIIDPEDTIKSTLEGGGVEQGLGKPRSGFPISLEIPTTWKYQQSGSPNDTAETEIDSLSPTSHHDDAWGPWANHWTFQCVIQLPVWIAHRPLM